MLEKTLHLNAIEFDHAKVLQVRLQKRITLDGQVLKPEDEWHRTAVPPGQSVERQMKAVNDHLAQHGFAPLPADDIATVAAAASAHHTPDVVAAYRAAVAASEASLA